MQVKQDAYDVGVIVGRFQVDELHEAHEALIAHVLETHGRVILFVGLSGSGQPTKENSLDYQARMLMLLERFPTLETHYIADMGDDFRWSQKLDNEVKRLLPVGQTAVLYGGRDSFVGRYHGTLPTRDLEPEVWVSESGTDRRKKISKKVKASADFRRGVIWATHARFPAVMPTVDVAVLNLRTDHLLLGRKPDEPLWRFLGGFADVSSDSFEHDAVREVHEESGIEIANVTYLGSFNIDDWRYRGEEDGIRTLFFKAEYIFGSPKPRDDIAALKWFHLSEVTIDAIMPIHHALFERLQSEDGLFPKTHQIDR